MFTLAGYIKTQTQTKKKIELYYKGTSKYNVVRRYEVRKNTDSLSRSHTYMVKTNR